MNKEFKSRFAKYLSSGIPVQISDDDQPIFYEKLDKFINLANNDFESIYIKGDNKLAICDKFVDYLIVSYEDSKIIFRTTSHTNFPAMLLEQTTRKKMGEAFLGVLLFIEGLSPTGEIDNIPGEYCDIWKS